MRLRVCLHEKAAAGRFFCAPIEAIPQFPQHVTMPNSESPARVIKKYPNRRLYDTETSAYITLVDVKALVMEGERFVVQDAKTGADLTRSILLQIILEEEAGGMPMLSTAMLEQLIRFYGNAMQGMMGSYLEKTVQAFIDIQGKLAEQSRGLYDSRSFSPEMWSQFLSGQAPMLQGMMSNYLEQSKNLYMQMQEQMQQQTKQMLGAFQAPPKR
ncbi:Polyhydroxyalkanoate synthesis repressor [Thiomonas delicata]|jgi:polyhydroxyalkanoate synthesis repressor PhaR|uniref:Polyhydroxyalkanoate synthesis repressor n=2 Tax=Burkholderiales genera incertae sedis TaxID=224471 RepID=A0A238D4P8_THIDL|nr:Polyhydroxyalkanoate synthesis repressor [Thiomonas delicata]